MPLRPFNREQAWLMPPSVEELIADDHPARFVDMVLDELDEGEWEEMGVDMGGDPMGAPAYHPRALVGVWVYGFMDGIRSTRKLERACRDQVPYFWLSCMQRPDHNTLWRFYKGHRERMRSLFRLSVDMAVRMELVDLAFQAVDGTKVKANASRERMLEEEGLERLYGRLERAISEMEAQNEGENEPPPARLPKTLAGREALREKTAEALRLVRGRRDLREGKDADADQQDDPGTEAEPGDRPSRASLADPDSRLLHARGGYMAGYNAQAVVSPLAGGDGMLITAANVAPPGEDDHAQLLPMIREAAANTGDRAEKTLADSNYHSGPNLARCEADGIGVLTPEANEPLQEKPYHKSHFTHDPIKDLYTCPHGKELTYRGRQRRPEKGYDALRYKAKPSDCRACPAFGECTASTNGRTVYVTPYEDVLRRHRERMADEKSRELYRKRKHTVEPPFGTIKEQMDGRRFLLRGWANVRAEWSLLAAAFNLRTLHRIWARGIARPTAQATA